jgi:phage terminase small subunit
MMLENLELVKSRRTCKVRTIMEKLDDKDIKLLKEYIATWNHYTLANALRQRGIIIDARQITTHTTHACSCDVG